jgi:uncharacterized protein (UPF0332 family)
MISVDLYDAAGRTAYMSGFHAAQALLFEARGRVFKTHSGVRAEFARLVRDEPRVGGELRAFLGLAYQLKSVADYEAGPGARLDPRTALSALATAERFVSCVEDILAADGQAPGASGAG